jgi:uncharacterized protein (TIGR03790 family)
MQHNQKIGTPRRPFGLLLNTTLLLLSLTHIPRVRAQHTSDDADTSNAAITATGPTRRNPSEVLIVYNAASPVSKAIANYYSSKRGVANVLAITCEDSAVNTSNETISYSNYVTQIQNPISAYLARHTDISFIVLTKGVPLRIDGAPTGSEAATQTTQEYQPSLDSYLAALGYSTANGDVQASIAGSGAKGLAWVNRFYNSNVPFTHAAFGGYLVTRLDAYTQADAMSLVDRSIAANSAPLSGSLLLDVDANFGLGDKTSEPPVTPGTDVTVEESFDHGNADLLHATDILRASGISVDSQTTTSFVGGQNNLLGYFSWGSNDSDYSNTAYESLSFAPGSIANTYVSTSMRSLIGQYVGFRQIDLTGMTSLDARVANGNDDAHSYIFQIRLDNPSGTVVGTCHVPTTGGWQTWETSSCALTQKVAGVHDIYLKFLTNGFGGALYNLEWISFQGSPSVIEAASYNLVSGTAHLEPSSEGPQDLGYITNGDYAVYHGINLADMTSIEARVASAGSGGAVKIHLDSPTGPIIGTCAIPVTGGWQEWATRTCVLTHTSGIHNVYLVFTGGSGYLFDLEWFKFLGGSSVVEVASYKQLSGTESLETSSEGAQDLGSIYDGQSLMGDLISNGLTGAVGYVDEPTLNSIVGLSFGIEHYEGGYTFAESMYAGTPYLGWEGVVVGDPLSAPYAGSMQPVSPTQAASFSGKTDGISTGNSSEGGMDLGNIANGSYVYYKGVDLAGMNTFRARVASASTGGNIQIRLDSQTGTVIGTCSAPATGGWQKWVTESCSVTATAGTHNLYLTFEGQGQTLFNLEWFALIPSIRATSYNKVSGQVQPETCSEGNQDLGFITNGSYAVYKQIDLTAKTHMAARTASAGEGGNIEVHLDSPTGTLVGTCVAPLTGSWQSWATQTCALGTTSGTHDIYLVFTGNNDYLFNLETFAFN